MARHLRERYVELPTTRENEMRKTQPSIPSQSYVSFLRVHSQGSAVRTILNR